MYFSFQITHMKKLVLLGFVCLFSSCKSSFDSRRANVSNIKIDTLLQGKFSIRAINIEDNKVFYGADNSRIGYLDLTQTKQQSILTIDTLKTEFRSIASNGTFLFVLNVANPAKLFKVSKDFKTVETVYHEIHEKVFYDSMQFWNCNEGIAIGDPITSCFNVIITRDGGNTWTKVNCDKLPSLADGEAAFAASNTNIILKKDKTWIVSGGKKSRIFYSADKGLTWDVFQTPIIEGNTMTGIFTGAFYNESIGIVSGGDYEKPNQNHQNKAITFDGGKNWKLIAENQGFGYASCIQFVPNSKAKEIVSVGANGIYYSTDEGQNWKQLSADPDLYTLRFLDRKTAIAAGKNKIIRIRFNP